MDNIHIVFEAPQEGHIRKKRARLVTSCDHCRLKKIKCTQSVNLSKCEACAAAQIPCRFRDREQYFAERGRVMSRGSPEAYDLSTASNRLNPQITMSILDSQQQQPSTPSTSHPADTDNTRSAKVATSPSTTNYSFVSSSDELQSPAPRSAQHSWQVGCDPSPLEVRPMGVVDRDYSIQGGSSQTTQPSRTESPLFDPRRTERPQPILMMHFIQIYFDRYGHSLPFLAYDETIRQFLEQSLSSLIANGIAALAAWYSDLPEVTQNGPANASNAYCERAKTLFLQQESSPSIEVLHGLLLLAWAEYKRAQMQEFYAYVQKAMYIAQQLGLANGSLIRAANSAYDRSILQATWDFIQQLGITVNSWTACAC